MSKNVPLSTIMVIFEFTDAYQSIRDDGDYLDDIVRRAQKLCDVFDYEFQLTKKEVDCYPNLIFSIEFLKCPVSFQHNMNVMNAFAQEFQILISTASERYTDRLPLD
jgi:hypothetical protein